MRKHVKKLSLNRETLHRLSNADLTAPPISRVNRYGGALPSQDEIVDIVIHGERATTRGAA